MQFAPAIAVNDSATDARRSALLVGLLGRGIAQSRTPAMHEAAARALDIPYIYRLIDGDGMGDDADLATMLRFARHFGFDGLNVTYPWKQEIIPLLDDLSPEARAVGSVNTVTIGGGRLTGHNTDCAGFRAAFELAMADAPRERVLLLGAGGAGGAVAQALIDSGAGTILICDTDREKAARLAARLHEQNCSGCAVTVTDPAGAAAEADGIVNATPVGMAKLPGSPLSVGSLRQSHWVADIVYFPLETELLKAARSIGCRVMTGEGMAIHQAVKAFELFAGAKPDIAEMTAAFRSFDRVDPV